MNRTSIRLRVALVVTVAMMLGLGAIGAYVYQRTERALDRSLTESLSSRLDDAVSTVRSAQDRAAVAEIDYSDRDDTFVQVVDPGNHVLADSGERDGGRILTSTDIRRARQRPVVLERVLEQPDPPTRVMLRRAELERGEAVVVLVGASRGPDLRALAQLRTGLLIGGALASLLTALIGYVAVALALRPVEHIRRAAAEITPGEPSRRLRVPTARDELARLATTLNAMLDRLERGIVRERQLTADASHELRTPLALLTTELEVALTEDHPTHDLAAARASTRSLVDTLRSVEAEVGRLVQLSESLLILARADEGDLGLVRTSTDVHTLLTDVGRRFERRAQRDGRALEVDAVRVRVDVDGVRVGQAVGNMIDNAFRHGAGTVRVDATVEDDCLVVHVRDEGAGIAPEFAQDAFSRFTRAESSRTSAGSGLGLAIVRAIASAHGGAAGIDPSAAGADVWIRLPGSTD